MDFSDMFIARYESIVIDRATLSQDYEKLLTEVTGLRTEVIRLNAQIDPSQLTPSEQHRSDATVAISLLTEVLEEFKTADRLNVRIRFIKLLRELRRQAGLTTSLKDAKDTIDFYM